MKKIDLKPLRQEIEDFLLKKGVDEKAVMHISNLITEYSSIQQEKDKTFIKVDKKSLLPFLNQDILKELPESFEIDFDSNYLIGIAIRDEQEEQVSRMDALIKEIEMAKIFKNEDIDLSVYDDTAFAIETILYTDKIPDDLKLKIIDRIEELSRKIEKLDKEIHLSIEKFYKDPLTGFFSNKFYGEFISDIVEMKRKEDITLYKTFMNNITQIKNPAIMYVDFANFKMANEIIGHNNADKILVKFASAFKNDKNILPIRMGGDEFLFIGEKSLLKQYKNKMESVQFIQQINPPELLKEKVFVFPAGGIVSLQGIEKYKNVDSIEKINLTKKFLSSLVKKAELESNEHKIDLKLKFNQPLTREEGLEKAKKINLRKDKTIER